jgi:hypothetical protein
MKICLYLQCTLYLVLRSMCRSHLVPILWVVKLSLVRNVTSIWNETTHPYACVCPSDCLYLFVSYVNEALCLPCTSFKILFFLHVIMLACHDFELVLSLRIF